MENTSKMPNLPDYEQWVQAKEKRNTYLTITVALFALAVIGIISSFFLSEPEPGWIPWILVNFGTYGIGGISAIYLIAMIILGISAFLYCISRTSLGPILSFVAGALTFGLGFTLFEKVIVWLFNSINTDFVISVLGVTVNGSAEIPVSGTLGKALLNTVIFTLPFIFCVVKLVLYARKASSLKKM